MMEDWKVPRAFLVNITHLCLGFVGEKSHLSSLPTKDSKVGFDSQFMSGFCLNNL